MSRVSGKAYFVYILWSPRARRFYTGLSENPQINAWGIHWSGSTSARLAMSFP
jgi:hypothetical protein